MSDVARIVVPCGWKRNVDSSKSAVSYVSPSGVALSSIVEVFQYLEKDDTCKCGLSCPIYVPKVFSFNPDVETTYYTREEWINYRNKSDVRMNKCQHWLKLRKMQRGTSKTSAPKSSSAEPPPKLLIIRKDGKLRSVIPDITSSSDKYKQSAGADTNKRLPKSTGTTVRKANEVTDLKLSLTSQSTSAPPSRNPSVTSPLKSPLFEPTTVTSASNSNVKSKLQWIKADLETTGNDAESDTELCFSPDFKESPTSPLPQSLMSGFVSPSKAPGFDAANRSMPVKSYGDSNARFGVHPNQDGNFAGTRPTSFAYMGVSSYDPPNYMQGNIRRLPQSNHIRHPSSTISSNPKFGGTAVHEQGRQRNSTRTSSDDQRQFFANDGGTFLHQAGLHHSNQTGNVFNMGTSAQATPVQQRLPLASPPLLNPVSVSPYNFPMSNNGMMAPLGSPVGTNPSPSPFSSRSQSRSSSVGTPALSPGGIWPGPRHNVSDSSRPMSRSSSTATPGPDVSPGPGLGQWNGNVPNNATYNVRTPSCSFLPVLSPGSVNSFPARFPTLPSTYSRFPHDGSAASGSSKYHQAPYPLEYAASQRLRMHSQACHQQHAQRFEVPPRFRHYGPTQSTFVNNAQFPVLMTGAPQQISHKPNESVHQNMLRPAPPYSATKIQPSRMGEPDGIAHAQPKFPFNSNQFNSQGRQQETGNIVQQQFAQQQWQYNASMTPRQYFAQNMMRPRAPITPNQRPQLRPPKPKRTRKRKTKIVPTNVEPVADTSTIKSEFPEIFDPQDLSGLISTTELLMEDANNEVATKTMKFNTSDLIQDSSSLTYTPSLVLPADVTTSSASLSSSQLISINPSSLLQSEKANNDEASFAKDLPDIDKPDCSERDVTTPPLPVLSPTCMLDNPGSPEDDHFPELDFGSTVSTSFLSFNPVTSAVTLATVVSVSGQSVTVDVVSSTDSTSSASVIIPASTQHVIRTDVFPASTVGSNFNIKNVEALTSVTSSKLQVCTPSVFAMMAPSNTPTSIVKCDFSTSSVTDGDVPTSATSSKRELSVTSLFTTAVSSSVVTQSTWSEKKLGVCSSSSKSDSAVAFSVNSCLPNFSSIMHPNRCGSSDVTSLVSSCGTLFHLPKLSKAKQVYIQRKLSFQSPAVCTESHTTTNRRRYFSEPWQSHISATTSGIATSSPNLSGFQTTPKTVIGKTENLHSKILQPQPMVFANVAKSVENFNDNTIYPKRKTVIDDTSNDRSLSEITTSTDSLHEVTQVTMNVTPDASDAPCSTLMRGTVGETLPQDLCIGQTIDQPLQEDMLSKSNTADMISKSPDVNVTVSASNRHGTSPSLSTYKTAAIDITVKEVLDRLVEEAISITLSNQQTISKKEKLPESSHCDTIVPSPHSSTDDLTSQECSSTGLVNKQFPTKLLVEDCQFEEDGTNAQSSVLGQTESANLPTHNDLIIPKIPTSEIPGALELIDAHMQASVDNTVNSENIDTVMVNSPEFSQRISPAVTEQEDDCAKDSLTTPTFTDMPQTVTNSNAITHNQPLCLTDSTDGNANLVRLADDSSETVNICPPIPKVANFGDNVDSHSIKSKNETACDPSLNIQDSQSEACPPTGKSEVSLDLLQNIHDLQSESWSSMIKRVGSQDQDLPQNIKESHCKSHCPTSKSENMQELSHTSQDMESESHLPTTKMESTPNLPQILQNSPTSQRGSICDLPHGSQESETEYHSPVNKSEIMHDMPQRIQDFQSNSSSPTSKSEITRDLPHNTRDLDSERHSPSSKSENTRDLSQDTWELQRDMPQDIQDLPGAPHSPTSKSESTHNLLLDTHDWQSTPHSPESKSESTSDLAQNDRDSGSGPHSPTNKIEIMADDQPENIQHSQSKSHSPISKSESTSDLAQNAQDLGSGPHSPENKIEIMRDDEPQNIQHSQSESYSSTCKSENSCNLPPKLPYSQSDSLPLASKSETKLDPPCDIQESQSKFYSTSKSESPQDSLQNVHNLQGFPVSICTDKDEIKVVSDPVTKLPTSGGDETQPVVTSNAEKLVANSSQKLQVTMSTSANEDHDNITTSQVSSEYCGAVVSSPMNIPPEWTTTVIQQLSSYNRILKNLLVRQVSPAANIAQLTSGSPNTDAKQADVISALLSNTVPQMASAEIFHKTAVAMHGTPTMPVLPVKDHQSAPQTFDPSIHPSTSQKVFNDAHQCASAVSDKPPALRGVESAPDDARTLLAAPPPPDSSQPLEDDAKIAKSFRGSDASHQGLQVPIVSSSVKGTQEESNNTTIKANNDGVQPQDKVTTSVKSACQTSGVTLERRRGRSRTAANKQAIKKQLPVEKPPVEKAPKRATSSGSSSHRSSQKSTRIVKNGDLVWGQMRGFPSWPGKIVKPSEVRGLQQRAPLSDGKVWVKWFGDHTFTQMNPADLVTMTEGLEAHHKSRRKGRTRTKKISAHLETAIQEAVDELEQQQGTSSRRFVEALQAAPLLGTTGKEQCEKPKRGRKRKAV